VAKIPIVLKDQPAVSIILKARLILINDGKILLLKQRKPNGGKYTLVGGTVEDFEMVKESLVREVKEEAGIDIKKSQLRLAHTLFKKKRIGARIVIYFVCQRYAGKPKNMEPKKFKSVSWHPLNALPTPMSPTVKHVLRKFKDSIPYSEIDWRK